MSVEVQRQMGYRSYQLWIRAEMDLNLRVGRLGILDFPAGIYIYTGSARKNLEQRIRRHLSTAKKIRWHIDYLLSSPFTHILAVHRSREEECLWNRNTEGEILYPRLGATDCRNGCSSHLKYLGRPCVRIGQRSNHTD